MPTTLTNPIRGSFHPFRERPSLYGMTNSGVWPVGLPRLPFIAPTKHALEPPSLRWAAIRTSPRLPSAGCSALAPLLAALLRRSYYLSSPLRGFSGVKTAGEPIRGHSVFEGKLLSSHASSRSEGGAVDRQAGVKPNLRGRQVRCETGPQRRTSREGGSGRPRGRHSASRFG
jgi:hypothetical protein